MSYSLNPTCFLVNQAYRTVSKPRNFLGNKLTEACKNLRPFQSLEFDPARASVAIITETVVPRDDIAQLYDVLAQCGLSEKLSVRCYADIYKITTTKKIRF